MDKKKRALPTNQDEWLDEIKLAIADARKTKPFGLLTGQLITDASLFHLAPLVCMKFRGFDHRDEESRRKVTEGALANYDKHRALYVEFSPYNHLDGNDPPLLMSYGNNMKLPSESAGHGIHHPMYGLKMKEKADRIGHECHLLITGVSKSEKYATPNDFLMAKLLAR